MLNTSRDTFPDGQGVNRRVGFSDLSPEAQDYLKKQKNLSLLNFANPAIFFINRIRISEDFSFNFFLQYAPTYFGNSTALYLPLKYRQYDLLFAFHNYNNFHHSGFGVELGIYNYEFSDKFSSGLNLSGWSQPTSFFSDEKQFGGAATVDVNYEFWRNFSAYLSLTGKSDGWSIGNPYLESNISFQAGIKYHLAEK